MQIDFMSKGTEVKKDIPSAEPKNVAASSAVVRQAVKENEEEQKNSLGKQSLEKDPTAATIDSVMSEANQKMKTAKTHCEYSYDEPTKRVSIKVLDDETGDVIREVPPEKSLEMLQKMWELAGIIVDEKR